LRVNIYFVTRTQLHKSTTNYFCIGREIVSKFKSVFGLRKWSHQGILDLVSILVFLAIFMFSYVCILFEFQKLSDALTFCDKSNLRNWARDWEEGCGEVQRVFTWWVIVEHWSAIVVVVGVTPVKLGRRTDLDSLETSEASRLKKRKR